MFRKCGPHASNFLFYQNFGLYTILLFYGENTELKSVFPLYEEILRGGTFEKGGRRMAFFVRFS